MVDHVKKAFEDARSALDRFSTPENFALVDRFSASGASAFIVTEIGRDSAQTSSMPSWTWTTVLQPSILTVYQVAPERLALSTLYDNIRVLGTNAQKTSRFEIAFWSKVLYPVAVLVMMVLALPFAQFQRRAGGVGFRIFAGTMLGLAFWLIQQLFAYLGVLNDWAPLFSAAFPLVAFCTLALASPSPLVIADASADSRFTVGTRPHPKT